jgi:bacteriocin resistance YdeI/OmpD-like protein/uncharacterized protein DUF1905
MRFRSVVELGGKTATGIEVPADVVTALGSSRRPSVRITVGAHTYRTTVASMHGRFMVPLSAENRAAAGVAAGDEVEVDLELDEAPREVAVPPDLQQAFEAEPPVQTFFDQLAFTHRKEWVRWIEEAKKPETRQRRVDSTVAALREGRRTR